MFISLVSVSYLFFYKEVPNHLGNSDVLADSTMAEQPLSSTASQGQVLFKKNCAKCHYATEQKSIGPGLKNVMQRINEEQLVSWVQNPTATIKKDTYFEKLVENFPDRMPAFNLTKEEILLIRDYIDAN
jgi:mono/diheme cytochrome c family protein